MGLFGALFGSDRPASELSEGKLVARIERFLAAHRKNIRLGPQDLARAKQDMLALGDRGFSEAGFALAQRNAAMGPLYKEARQALGAMGHPKSAALLVAMLANRGAGGSREDLIPILGQARNACAAPELLRIALTDHDFLVVELMIKALQSMGAPDSEAALAEFRRGESRELTAVYFETPEPVFTSRLGQVPGEAELKQVLPEISSKAGPWAGVLCDYLFADDAYVGSMIVFLADAPSDDRARGLETFLATTRETLSRQWLTGSIDEPGVRTLGKLLKYPSLASDLSVKALVRRAADDLPRRQQMVRGLLTSEIRSRIEAGLGRALDI